MACLKQGIRRNLHGASLDSWHTWRGRLLHREPIQAGGMQCLARLQLGGWKAGVVRRIGKVLRLKAQRRTMRVELAAFALHRAVEEVSGVELHPRLGGQDLQYASGLRIVHSRGE